MASMHSAFSTEGIIHLEVLTALLPRHALLCTNRPGTGPVLCGSLAALTQKHVQQSGSKETGPGTRAGFHQGTA